MPRPLRPPDGDNAIRPRPSALQIARVDGDRLLVRGPRGVSLLPGIAREDLERVLEQVDGRRTVQQICDSLIGDYEPDDVSRLLRHLTLPAPRTEDPQSEASEPTAEAAHQSPLLVLGAGIAARRVAELLRAPRRATGLAAENLDPPPSLVICALEDAPYEELFEIQRACLRTGATCLFVTLDPDGTRVGPTVAPGAGPCFACAQIASFRVLKLDSRALIPAVAGFRTGTIDASTFERAAREVAREARAVIAGRPRRLTSVLRIADGSRDGETTYSVTPAASCPLCGTSGNAIGDPTNPTLADAARRELLDAHRRAPRLSAPPTDADLCSSIGILGGGTAGYLTALAMRRRFPRLAVTLIESSQVPIIGVGEATTPLMPQFLHVDLGLDVHEFFRQVQPTLKLGIRFDWGSPTGEGFHYPFGPVHVLEPAVHEGDVRRCSPQSLLMSTGALPVHRMGADWHSSLGVDAAYHLDNERFVRYLRRQAEDRGIPTIDARISDVEVAHDRESVTTLIADDGRRFDFDLYVDCTGFRSLLLEQSLGSPFQSFGDSLFTDRALIASVPHGGQIQPYTLAETLSAGWCWSTPQRDADHRGYVFCSEFASPEEAEAEMRHANPGMGEARLIEFRAGRHEHFWRGNVVAMSNAYGFVEPLESTALHMLIRQIGMLLRALPMRRGERGVPALLNRRVGDFWDYLRWFLAIHFRFNRRLDTPFWQSCRNEVDVSHHTELLDAFRERGPLSYRGTPFGYPDPLWGAEGVDVLLLGQGVPAKLPRPVIGREEWCRRADLYEDFARRATPQAKALELFDERPELLDRWLAEFRRVGPAFGG